jgi:hypothetical protein
MGDVQSVEPELDGEFEQVPKVVRVSLSVVEVDGLVHVADLLAAGLPLVQLRGQGRLDALPEEPRQE